MAERGSWKLQSGVFEDPVRRNSGNGVIIEDPWACNNLMNYKGNCVLAVVRKTSGSGVSGDPLRDYSTSRCLWRGRRWSTSWTCIYMEYIKRVVDGQVCLRCYSYFFFTMPNTVLQLRPSLSIQSDIAYNAWIDHYLFVFMYFRYCTYRWKSTRHWILSTGHVGKCTGFQSIIHGDLSTGTSTRCWVRHPGNNVQSSLRYYVSFRHNWSKSDRNRYHGKQCPVYIHYYSSRWVICIKDTSKQVWKSWLANIE